MQFPGCEPSKRDSSCQMIYSFGTVCPSSIDELMCNKSKTTLISFPTTGVSPRSQTQVHIPKPTRIKLRTWTVKEWIYTPWQTTVCHLLRSSLRQQHLFGTISLLADLPHLLLLSSWNLDGWWCFTLRALNWTFSRCIGIFSAIELYHKVGYK